ncbi:MAG: two-component regulator propeller domain-containing protein [Bacteroidia bacterium]
MTKLLFILSFLIIIPCLTQAQKIGYNGVGRWRTHFPYKDVKQIQEAGDFIFVTPEKGFFTFHQQSGEVSTYSKVNGLSDIDIAIMRFIPSLNKMVFVYTTGNIDILDLSNNTIWNIPDILRKSILGDKEFFDLQFFDGFAYLSCSFGIIKIDLNKLEISDSYQFKDGLGAAIPIYSTIRFNDFIYAGTSKGIYRAHATNGNLSDFTTFWKNVKPGFESKLLRVFDNKLFAVNDSIIQSFNENPNNIWQNVSGNKKRNSMSLEVCHNQIIETHWGGFLKLKPGGGIDSVRENAVTFGVLDINGTIWTGGTGLGCFNIKPNGEYGFVGINGPNAITSYSIAGWKDEIWVTGGGPNYTFGPSGSESGYYYFKDNLWHNRPSSPNKLIAMHDFTAIAINKANGETWLGSHGTGIAQLQNGNFINRFDTDNSTLGQQANTYTHTPGLAIDSKGNLWVANFDADSCISARLPNGNWVNFRLSKNQVGEMVIDDLDQKWMVTPRSGSTSPVGVIVFKEASNGKPQQERTLYKGKGSGDLPSSRVNALVMDKDNEIWIGTDEGLAVFFNPARAFDNEEDAQRIIVDQNGVVGYLLGSETINDICIDGANRKWVATNNGVFLVEKDGTSVLEHFTIDNSPLPSNVIKSVGVNGSSGEVFFGTENGLISYGGNATEASDEHNDEVKIYPNPVHKNYDGDITIQGLPDYATVKITDVSGRIIYETLSNGGIATWNGKMFNGQRPQTGIYLIISSNKEDKNSKVNKLLFVN